MEESRRDRKKRLTRQRIADSAIKLVLERGYDLTTVAEIAAAADVDPKTFFNYFGNKDEVLFDASRFDEVIAAMIKDRRPDDDPGRLLGRFFATHDTGALHPLSSSLGPPDQAALTRLILSTPSLQAKVLTLLDDLQRRFVAALLAEFPDELDELTATATIGALIGATYQVALVSIRNGRSREDSCRAIRHASEIVLNGVASRRRTQS
ncbi:TetR/AcrR family transcriptional regulator [Microlunatus sp. GCM10028923]|uniref:TetR/AcrR family transcriptional regulator n=1 Tax=Microlunatus sp. GCM10028923 TaxID=3273400 RepID=UPI00361C3BC1